MRGLFSGENCGEEDSLCFRKLGISLRPCTHALLNRQKMVIKIEQ
jgi:hypothetical protein